MDHDEDNSFPGHVSSFMGAIFMSNRMTKKECFQRKLFGLPMTQAGLVKKVRPGMILFLFEHEERKLYGIFEATTNGAINIVPNAFYSSGMHFPAQVQFRIIWSSDSLCEDEFGGAIEDNYFTPHKFSFALSYEQVVKLIHLFSSKNARSQHYKSPRLPIIVPKKSGFIKSRVSEKERYLKLDAFEDNANHDIDSVYPGSYAHNRNHTMCDKNPDRTLEVHKSHTPVPGQLEQRANPIHSTSPSDCTFRERFPTSPSHDPWHNHNFPCFRGEEPIVTLGIDVPSFALSGYSKNAHVQAPFLRSLSSSLEGLSVPQCEPGRASLLFRGTEGYNHFQECNSLLGPKYYGHSTPQIYSSAGEILDSNGTEPLPSVSGPSYTCCFADACQQQDASRREQYWHQGPLSDYIPLSKEENLVPLSDYIPLSKEENLVPLSDYIPLSKEEDLVPFSDYIPLSTEENSVVNMETSHFIRSPEDVLKMQYSHSSKSQVDSDYKVARGCLFASSNDCAHSAANASLYSDTYKIRTSVFSRLSTAPRVHGQEYETCISDTTPVLDQLLELVSQRRNQWNKIAKAPIKFINQGDEILGTVSKMELDGTDSIINLKRKGGGDEESIELPYFNFKRRSKVMKVEDVAETGHVEYGNGSCKRKLVRPSFSDVDTVSGANTGCQNVQCSSKEVLEFQTLIRYGESKVNTEISDSAVTCHKNNENRSTLSVEPSHGISKVIIPKDHVGGSEDCEISVAKELTEEPAINQASVAQGTGTVEKLTLSQSGTAGERVMSSEDIETAVLKVGLCGAHNGMEYKLSEVSKEDSNCYVDGEHGGKKCDGVAEMGNIVSDGSAEMCSGESDLYCVGTTHADLKEKELELKLHVAVDVNTALPVDKFGCQNSDENGEKNVVINSGSIEKFSQNLMSNTGSDGSTAEIGNIMSDGSAEMCSGQSSFYCVNITHADLKEKELELKLHVTCNENTAFPADKCGCQNSDENGEKNVIINGGSIENFSQNLMSNTGSGGSIDEMGNIDGSAEMCSGESDFYCVNMTHADLKERELKLKLHVAGDENTAFPVDKCGCQNSDENGDKNVIINGGSTEKFSQNLMSDTGSSGK